MQNKRKIGGIYECKAIELLKKNGYEILELNYYSKYGEIDIIAKKDNCLLITEVKYRNTKKFGIGIESITKTKLKRIYNTAMEYISKKNLQDVEIRFDSICFFKDDVSWVKNLFWGDEIGF